MTATPMLTAWSQKPTSNESLPDNALSRRLAAWSSEPIQVSDHAATAPARKAPSDGRSPRVRPTIATIMTVATPPKRNTPRTAAAPPPSRWLSQIDIGCEGLSEGLGGEVKVGALAAVRVGKRDGPDRRPHKAAFELLEEQLLALAHVAHPAVEIDERLDLIIVDGGGGDDIAALRVADEHDRPAKSPQELG
jgi:hypothetical protein